MSCPAWEDCHKKACLENERCWKDNHLIGLSAEGIMMKEIIVKEEHNPCTKVKGICDKDATCKFLGQCIFTISAVKGNKKLIKALSGRHKAIGQVLAILKEHNPKPMKSYYFGKKSKK